MGNVSLIMTTIVFFAMLLVNPVGMFIYRLLHAWHQNGLALSYFVLGIYYLSIVASLAAISIPYLITIQLINFDISVGWMISLVVGYLFVNTINQTAIPSLNMLGYINKYISFHSHASC